MEKTTIGIIIVSILVLAGGAYLVTSSGVTTTTSDEPLELAEKVTGNPDSDVVLVEYSDFQCPACGAFEPVVQDVLSQYGDQIRFEYHNFPLISIHRNAEAAARAAEAAGVQGKFWEMHDLLFERQQQWADSITPKRQFVSYAEELGLDTAKFEQDLDNKTIREAVQNEMRAGRDLNITGTPTFFLNGEKMEYQTYNDFINAIEVALGVATEETPASETNVDFSF